MPMCSASFAQLHRPYMYQHRKVIAFGATSMLQSIRLPNLFLRRSKGRACTLKSIAHLMVQASRRLLAKHYIAWVCVTSCLHRWDHFPKSTPSLWYVRSPTSSWWAKAALRTWQLDLVGKTSAPYACSVCAISSQRSLNF